MNDLDTTNSAIWLGTHAAVAIALATCCARGHRAAVMAAAGAVSLYAAALVLQATATAAEESARLLPSERLAVPAVQWSLAMTALCAERLWGRGYRSGTRYGVYATVLLATVGTIAHAAGTAAANLQTATAVTAGLWALTAVPAAAAARMTARRSMRREDWLAGAGGAIVAAAITANAAGLSAGIDTVPAAATAAIALTTATAMLRSRNDDRADALAASEHTTAQRVGSALCNQGNAALPCGGTIASATGRAGAVCWTVHRHDEHRYSVSLAEVEADPLSAQIEAAAMQRALERRQSDAHEPHRVLESIARERAAAETKRPRVRTACAYVNQEKGTVRLANAGLPPATVHARVDHRTSEHAGTGGALGETRVAIRSIELPLRPGDRLTLVTESIHEAPDRIGTPFGGARIAATLLESSDTPEADLSNAIVDRAQRWTKQPGPPDTPMTAITIEMPKTAASTPPKTPAAAATAADGA